MKSERDYLLRRYYGVDTSDRRPSRRSRITQHDYMAIPIPTNLARSAGGALPDMALGTESGRLWSL